MSLTAKVLGIAVPVFLSTTFCLTVPFILLVADAVILGAAVVVFVGERRERRRLAETAEPVAVLSAD
ncbi:MAG: hypothetical protein GF405_06555 [Candidatus Eisenbacteria bacterium]|nr:hypothetical protein [Candidatus Eisenbacteria bacterium]